MTEKADQFSLKFDPSREKDAANDNQPLAAEAGKPCPVCKLGIMDYDGLLNLVCPVCGFTQGGCFT